MLSKCMINCLYLTQNCLNIEVEVEKKNHWRWKYFKKWAEIKRTILAVKEREINNAFYLFPIIYIEI